MRSQQLLLMLACTASASAANAWLYTEDPEQLVVPSLPRETVLEILDNPVFARVVEALRLAGGRPIAAADVADATFQGPEPAPRSTKERSRGGDARWAGLQRRRVVRRERRRRPPVASSPKLPPPRPPDAAWMFRGRIRAAPPRGAT